MNWIFGNIDGCKLQVLNMNGVVEEGGQSIDSSSDEEEGAGAEE